MKRKKTLLADLVERQMRESVDNALARTVDRVADGLVADLLKQPGFRDEMNALMQEAFRAALVSLKQQNNQPPASGRE
jgi:hypothetical protein